MSCRTLIYLVFGQRHICRQINHSDGIFNIQTIAEEVELERRLLRGVTVALTEAKTAENSEKIWHVVRNSALLDLPLDEPLRPPSNRFREMHVFF